MSLSFCNTCTNRPTCSTICKKVKQELAKDGIKSANWIRPRVSPKRDKKEGLGRWREVPFSSLGIPITGWDEQHFRKIKDKEGDFRHSS